MALAACELVARIGAGAGARTGPDRRQQLRQVRRGPIKAATGNKLAPMPRALISDEDNQDDNEDDARKSQPVSLGSVCSQLLALVCGLLIALYLINFVQAKMTNLLAKILGSGDGGGGGDSQSAGTARRRSVATPTGASRDRPLGSPVVDQPAGSSGLAQSRSSLSLARGSASPPPAGGAGSSSSSKLDKSQRRASRGSIQSLFSALVGGGGGGSSSGTASSTQATGNHQTLNECESIASEARTA